MRHLLFLLALAGLALLGLGPAAAPAAAQDFPKFTGFVVDDADVLPPDVEAALTAKLAALQKDTKRQLVVASIRDLQGYPIEDYGYRLGRAWAVGLADVNNGAILFIAPNEGKGKRGPRIEVGYGLEPVLTDALSSQIIREEMLPRLRKNGDIAGAMTAGTDAIIAQLRASPDEAKARTDAAIAKFDRQKRRGASNDVIPLSIVAGLLVLSFVLLAVARRGMNRGRKYRGGKAPVTIWGPQNRDTLSDVADVITIVSAIANASRGRRSSGWGGGSSGGGSDWGGWGGGGFSGGGGGSFGGGGASGDW